MYSLRVITLIAAPADRCFDLARSVDVHVQSAGASGEKVIGGRLTGLLELGEEVTWEGRHFGIIQRLTSKISEFDRPRYFQDQMIRGAFRMLEHDHHFEGADNDITKMTDTLRFAAPCGPFGWLVERVLIAQHLRRFLTRRGVFLKKLAEQSSKIV